MPRYGRRRTYRRRRRPTFRRRTFRRRTLRRPRYLFKRKVQFSALNLAPNTVAQNGMLLFKLEDIPQYTDITNLFDSYCIRKVKVDFLATVNDFTASFVESEIPQVLTCIDKNTTTTLSGVDTVMAYQNCRQYGANRNFSRSFRPYYIGSASTQIGSVPVEVKQNWIPTSSSSLPHYGLQWAVPTFDNPDDVIVQVWVTYWIQCRNVR